MIGPVETEYGLHLIEVLDRRMQTLSDEEYQASQQGYFRLWIDTLRAQATIERGDGWDAAVPDQPGLDALDPRCRRQSRVSPASPNRLCGGAMQAQATIRKGYVAGEF